MRNKFLHLILLFVWFAVCRDVNAQEILVRIDKPFVARSLSGIIVNVNGETMPFVKVKRLTAGWKNEIESLETEPDGKFNFRKLPLGTYYLKFSAEGFNEMEVKVRLKKHSKAKLKFVLEIGT